MIYVTLIIQLTVSFQFLIAHCSADDTQQQGSILNYIVNQYEALRRFYFSTEMYSESSKYLHNWSFDIVDVNDTMMIPTNYCNFTGITCDRNFMVTNLELNSTNLAGSLPDTFGSFTKLRRLRLFNNSIQGMIPSSLLQLSTLQLINLGQNQFSGTFPNFAPSAVLSRIALNRNAISGTIPSSMCQLTNLVVLEISHLTRMRGSIPECFGSLSALKAFRLTNIGLIGTIPSDLCTVREMNGLTPNTFGCDAIACPEGTYQRANGRQSNVDRPCTPCIVPSNIIGTTTCQWHEGNTPSQSPTLQPSFRTGAPTSKYPSPIQVESQSPSIRPSTSYPSLSYPTEAPFWDTIQPSLLQTSINGPRRKPGFIAGMALLCVALVAFVAIIFVSKRRPLLPNHKRLTDETSSHHGSSLQEFLVQDDLLPAHKYPLTVNVAANHPESKEFDVEDDVSFTLKELNIIRLDSIKDGVDLFPMKEPITQDTLQDNILHVPNVQNPKILVAENHKHLQNARRVRFDVPESNLTVSTDNRNNTIGATTPSQTGPDDWIAWILNPLFDQIATCGTPCRDISRGEVDIRSTTSMDSSHSKLSAFAVVRHDNVDFPARESYRGETTNPLKHPPDNLSLLGIRDLHSMNDDNSLNSFDTLSDIDANRGTIFRPSIESRQRRARAIWEAIQENMDDGTGEV